jgi:hypothetical protein
LVGSGDAGGDCDGAAVVQCSEMWLLGCWEVFAADGAVVSGVQDPGGGGFEAFFVVALCCESLGGEGDVGVWADGEAIGVAVDA